MYFGYYEHSLDDKGRLMIPSKLREGLVAGSPLFVIKGYEGCLSVKGKYGTVTRAQNVTAKAQDRYGKEHIYKVSGFTARAFQHEIDHLNGKMDVDLVEGELCKG